MNSGVFMITKAKLKQEIDLLDETYLELAYRLLQQFPHQSEQASVPDPMQCSKPIDYAVQNIDDEPVLPEIMDAASYIRNLRDEWRH